MFAKLAAWVGMLAMTLELLVAATALAQEQVELVPQLRIKGVDNVAFSPDGRTVLTGGGDEDNKDWRAWLWDAATGQMIRSLVGHTSSISGVAFSPDGRYALTGSQDGTARLWDAATGQQVRSFKVPPDQMVTSVAFSPDGQYVLTGSGMLLEKGNTVRLWDAATGQQIRSFEGHTNRVQSVAFSPDGRYVLTGSDDKTARLWDATTGQQIRSFEGHTEEILSVVFSPDGRYVLTGSRDKTVRLWDAATGQKIRSFEGHTNIVSSVAFSPDGRYVLTGSDDKTVRLWNVLSGEQIRSFTGNTSEVSSVAFSPDGRFVLTCDELEAILWDATAGQQIRRFQGRTDQVQSVAFSPDGRLLLTGNLAPIARSAAQLWDTAVGQQIRSFPGKSSPSNSVPFFRDNRFMLTDVGGNMASVWNESTDQPIRSFAGPTDADEQIGSVAVSRDGRFVAVAAIGDHNLRLWDVATGKQIRLFVGPYYNVDSIAFSPSGRLLLTQSETGTALLWDVATGKPVRTFKGPTDGGDGGGITSVAFSPDGRSILTGSVDQSARLWNATTGRQICAFEGHTDAVMSVAFSLDNRYALTGSWDHTARLWDAASCRELRSFSGHSGVVNSVAFSPDGLYVFTGSADTTTRLWSARTGHELATLISFENAGWAVVDPSGRFDTSDLDGGAPLAWVASSEPMRSLPLEIFMRDYYTPRLLARIMNGEKLAEVRSISEIKNRVQPEVDIVSVSPSKAHPGRADVVVHAASGAEEKKDEKGVVKKDTQGKAVMQASGLQDLRLFRDGQLVKNTELNQPLKDGDVAFDDIQLPTSAKSVTFTAYAFNSERIKGHTVAKEYKYEPGTARKSRAWLVQVGVNHYEAEGCELHGSVNDAEELSKVLEQKLKDRGLDVQRPVLLVSDGTGEGATREGIRAALAKIAAEATPDDVFFLSFSGHGYGDKSGQFYIFPANIEGSCRDVNASLLKNAISADDLAEWLRPIDAGEMTFVLDSCQSASSVEADDFKPGPMGSRGLGQLAYDKRIRILAASQGNQAAQETNLVTDEGAGTGAGESRMRGLLSYALTDEGLLQGKADWKPVDGKITVGEWLTFAADAVPRGLVAGAGRGFALVAEPVGKLEASQVPTVFDFAKKDTFVLQEAKSRAKP